MKISKLALVAMMVFLGIFFFPLNSLSKEKSKENTIVLSKSNTVVLNGEIEGETVGEVIAQARKLTEKRGFLKSKEHIYLFMNTPGGSIQSGLELVEALKGLSRPVDTITLFSASMGFQLVQALGERFIVKNGVLMAHRAQGEFSGFFGGQKPSQIDSRYALWLSRIDEMDNQTVARSKGKQTLESYRKQYTDEMWLTGSQSVEQGYADKVVTVTCDSSLDGVTTHTVDFFGIKILYDTDNCPLNTEPMNIRIELPKEKDKVPNTKKAAETKKQFLEQYISKQRNIVPMY